MPSNGIVVGGRSLLTSSGVGIHPFAEVDAQPVGAVFVDAGDAAANRLTCTSSWATVPACAGAALWGPLKLDVAYGRDVQQLRVHFSVGISL